MPDFGSAGLSDVSSSTAPVTPSVSATPNAMSATSALLSALSARSVDGASLNLLFALSACIPNTAPTTAAAPPTPRTTYAGTFDRGSGGGGAAGGAEDATGAAEDATGGGGAAAGAGRRSRLTSAIAPAATSTSRVAGSWSAIATSILCLPGLTVAVIGDASSDRSPSIFTLAPGGFVVTFSVACPSSATRFSAAAFDSAIDSGTELASSAW